MMASNFSPKIEIAPVPLPATPSNSKPSHQKSRWPAVRKVLRDSGPSRNATLLTIKVPDYCDAHVPIHQSFYDEKSFALFLAEVERKDKELEKYLSSSDNRCLEATASFDETDENKDTFSTSPIPKKTPEDLQQYQEFVSMFISLFLQSNFAQYNRGVSREIDPNDFVRKLNSTNGCPDDIKLFCRVAIDPKLIAAGNPEAENTGYAENGVPINQLARLLDVAVLQFLSSVNEHTKTHSIIWALDYMKNLLYSLITSMNTLNSFGWYGAPHIRIRKGTFVGGRASIISLHPPVILNPPVVVVGSPPGTPRTSPERAVVAEEPRDPVTGQSPALSPLLVHQTAQSWSPQLSTKTASSNQLRKVFTYSGFGAESREEGGFISGGRGAFEGGGGAQTRRTELHGILKSASLDSAISPPRSPHFAGSRSPSPSHSLPHSVGTRSPSPSHNLPHFGLTSPSHNAPTSPLRQQQAGGRKRKVTPAFQSYTPGRAGSIPTQPPGSNNMVIIHEEEANCEEGKNDHKMVPLPTPPQLHSGVNLTRFSTGESMNSIQEGKEGLLSMDSLEKDHFGSVQKELGSPVQQEASHGSPVHQQECSGSPPKQGIHRFPVHSRSFTPPILDSILEEANNEDENLKEAIRLSNTPGPSQNSSSSSFDTATSLKRNLLPDSEGHAGLRGSFVPPPPPPKNIPDVDTNVELESLINGEGRISLIALLHAIAKFPRSKEIWTKEVGEKCFSLIQLCMDIGLPSQKDDTIPKRQGQTSVQDRRKRFIKQDNIAFNKLIVETPWKIHGKRIIEFSVKALIQCSTCCMVGCSHDLWFCRLRQYQLYSPTTSMHSKLIRNMKRMHLHSPVIFRETLIKFAQSSMSSCCKLFRFLHVLLQYCMDGAQEVHFDSLLASVVASVLSVVVDRMVSLDVTETSIQDDIVREACDFFNYSNKLFYHDTTKAKPFQHLHMYIHRIALSIILPPRPVIELTEPISPINSMIQAGRKRISLEDTNTGDGSCSPKTLANNSIIKRKSFGTSPSSSPLAIRERSSSMHLSSSSSTPASEPNTGKTKGGKSPLLKQQTIVDIGKRAFFKTENSSLELDAGKAREEEGGGGGGGDKEKEEKEWRGLKLDVLRNRIQRLVVLMNLCEPGTIPDPGMLASLVDLCDGTTVVGRSMVLLECAMFVRSLCSQTLDPPCTIWVQHNMDKPSMHNVTSNLQKWAVAIGEKLRLAELKEREMEFRLSKKSSGDGSAPVHIPEEPVFPDEHDITNIKPGDGESPVVGLSMSYALKMAACNLLLEITRFLRDIPSHFAPVSTPLVSNCHSVDPVSGRRDSRTSLASSDAESMAHPASTPWKQSSEFKFGSSLSVEDAEPPEFVKSVSIEDSFLTGPRRKRASMYLHVSASNKLPSSSLGRSTSSSFRRQSRRVRIGDSSPGEVRTSGKGAYNVPLSPSLRKSVASTQRSRRMSIVYPNSFLSSGQTSHTSFTPSTETYYPINIRRKSIGAIHSQHSLQESYFPPPPTTPSTPHPPQTTSSTSKPPGGSSLGNSLNIGLTKLKRSAQRAFRRHGTKSKSVEGSSPNSSPGLAHKKKLRRSSISESYLLKSAFYSTLPEDNWRSYPWLDVIEHLILVDASNRDTCLANRRSCRELISALKKVYSRSCQEDDEMASEQCKNGKESVSSRPSMKMKHSGSLGAIFIHRLTLGDALEPVVDGKSSVSYNRGASLPVERTRMTNRRVTGSTDPLRSISVPFSSKKSLQKFSFSSVNYTKYINTFLRGRIPLPGLDLASEETIQLTIEDSSPFEKDYLSAQSDKERCKYIDMEYAGLMHVPFSTLVYSAPILHAQTFSSVKGAAWDMLLSTDHELSHVSGAFFLLACAKEGDKAVKDFVAVKVTSQKPKEQYEAILRFKILWECRYGVWPRMEERAQKKLNFNSDKEDKNEQTIGYSLLANLLGHPGEDLPCSPCEPVSVCTSKVCKENSDKCYRSTKLAPVVHTDEISDKVRDYFVSGVSITQETSMKSNSVVYHGFESEDINGLREWEAVDPTLFPHSLLPLIRFLITALVPDSFSHSPSSSSTASSSSSSSNDPQQLLVKSELARQVVWTCMCEDPKLFFRPLLNQFNKLYMLISDMNAKRSNMEHLLAICVKPFHIVLHAFPKLPPRAAHTLLNNFVGVVTQHTDQPYALSGKIIQSVLTLITMVTPSVQGLDSKLLKNFLKKTSCYTTIMTTARIRGVERVLVHADYYEPRLYKVLDDMTFGHLIAESSHADQLTLELLNNWYLVEKNREFPLLSSLVIQDHYSTSMDNQHLTFVLRKAENPSENVWGHQMDQLFVYKMSEIMRVLFTARLIQTGPELEKGFTYSEFAIPNFQFIHNELVELNSFPRKALTSVLYEAGSSALQHFQLRASDIMLKGLWVQFVLQLITSASQDYDWSNSMVLFVNVINGSLLLHSEDQTILYHSLVAILTVVTKFNSIFKKDGYQMIIPTLVQVYSLHMNNKLITKAIKFVWSKFYLLNKNTFFLQVMAAASILLSEEAALLSNNVSSTLAANSKRSMNMEVEEAKRMNAKALFELNGILASDSYRVEDELNILHCCRQYLHPDLYQQLLATDSRQCLSLREVVLLCTTLARWNPEAIRGMQVLVFLNHMMPFILSALGMVGLKFMTDAVQYLVKGCESISKPQIWRGDILHTRKGASQNPKESKANGLKPNDGFVDDDITNQPSTSAAHGRSSVVKIVSKILYNPKKNVHFVESGTDLAEPSNPSQADQIDHAAYQNQFRLRRIQSSNFRVLLLSRDSLLSIVSEYCLFYSRGGVVQSVVSARKSSSQTLRRVSMMCPPANSSESVIKMTLEPSVVLVLVTLATQMIKQGGHNDLILQGKGLNSFFAYLLPNLDWTEGHFSSFNNLLYRLTRFFKQLQRSSNKALMVWDNLTNFINGLTICIHHNPQLIQGQDQHLTKLKYILETVMIMQEGRSDPHVSATAIYKKFRGIHIPLLASAPYSFAESIVGLAVELIAITSNLPDYQMAQGRFRYHISDLVTLKSLKENRDFLMPKIFLPLCIQLGMRADVSLVSIEDISFLMEVVENKVELSLKFPHQKHLPEQIFRVLKVISCAFSNTLTLYHWNQIAQWILSLFNKKLSLPQSLKRSSFDGRAQDKNRTASVSGSNVSPLESFISFHEHLLSFFESFLMVYHVPLFSLVYPVLWKLEPMLQQAKQGVIVDNPAQLENVSSCIERCQQLQKSGFRIHSMKGREQLLRDLSDDLRWLSQNTGRGTLNRSNTTLERASTRKKSIKKRRNSEVTLAKIHEEAEHENVITASSSTLPRGVAMNAKKTENRPKTLGLQVQRSSSVNASFTFEQSRKKITSKPGLSTISDSPQRTKLKKLSDVKKSPRKQAKDDESGSHAQVRTRRAVKSKSPKPPQTEMEKYGEGMDYAADVEDTDDPSNKVVNKMTNSPAQLVQFEAHNLTPNEDRSLVFSNLSDRSPLQARNPSFEANEDSPFHQVVEVEVHVNSEATNLEGEEIMSRPVALSTSHDSLPSTVHNSSQQDKVTTGQQDLDAVSSESKFTPLLETAEGHSNSTVEHNSPKKRKRSKSPLFITKRGLSLSPLSQLPYERDCLIDGNGDATGGRGNKSPYFAWEATNIGMRKTYSFDHNHSPIGNRTSTRKDSKQQFHYSGLPSNSGSEDES